MIAIECDFGIIPLPADAPDFINRRDIPRITVAVMDMAQTAWASGGDMPAMTWAALLAVPVDPARLQHHKDYGLISRIVRRD